MAIKDRDGNVYHLRGPNPLVKNRADWDQKNVILINLKKIKEEVIEDKKKDQKKPIDIAEDLNLFEGPEPSKPVSPQNFIEEATQVETKIDVKKEKKEFSININVDERAARALLERGVEYYCAPVIGNKEIVDELYGTSYSVPKYGTKFLFDAIVIDQSDLQLQIWCIKDLVKGSVIYRKNQQGGERWWRITETEKKSGGSLCLASISDVNPDFT